MAADSQEILEQHDVPQTDDAGKIIGTYRVITYRDGRVERWLSSPGQNPDTHGARVQVTDKDRTYAKQLVDAANTQTDNARQAAAAKAPETAEDAAVRRRTEAANATTAEVNAAKATAGPEMITRSGPTPGTNASVDDPRSQTTDRVTKTQFDADRATAQDARQAQQDILSAAQAAETKARAEATAKIASERWTAEQAATEYNKQLDQIRTELAQQTAALTARGQEISLRGQDISAGTAARGQDMSYATSLAGEMGADRRKKADFWTAPGQVESYNSQMAGGPPVATRPSRGPFADDAAMQSAQQAQAMVPSQFTLPGAPPPVPPQSPYVLK